MIEKSAVYRRSAGWNRRLAAALLLCATLASCGGQTAAQKDARQRREDAKAISLLNEATDRAAQAEIQERIAKLRHREALARLRADERAATESP